MNMRRLAIFAVFQCVCVAAFSQVTAAAPGSASNSKTPTPPAQFHFDDASLGLLSPTTGFGNLNACGGAHWDQNQTSTQPDANQLSHVPCLNADKLLEMAELNAPAFAMGGRQWSGGKAVPIPTQWPGAKFEQIPTTWANLKMEPIQEKSSGKAARR
jgi:hypothetical protein